MTRIVVLLTVGLVSVALLAQTANVSGNWELEMRWPGDTSRGTCSFQQDGQRLTGTCGGDDKFPLNGRVEGNRVSWQMEVPQGGATFRMEFAGELDPQSNTISGACTIVGANDGTFTLRKAG